MLPVSDFLNEHFCKHRAAGDGQYVTDCLECEKPDHLYIRQDDARFRCHRCGWQGDAYKLASRLSGREGREVFDLLRRFGIELGEQQHTNGNDKAAPGGEQPRESGTAPEAERPDFAAILADAQAKVQPHDYRWLSRQWGVPQDLLQSLGVAKVASPFRGGGNVLAFAMHDSDGHVVGLQCEHYDLPKRLNWPGSQLGIFRAPMYPREGHHELVVVEGLSDWVAACHIGLNAIGLPGAGQAVKHFARLAKGKECLIVGDHDQAGKDGAAKAAQAAVAAGCKWARVVIPPTEGADLCDWAKAAGDEFSKQFRAAVEAAPAFEGMPTDDKPRREYVILSRRELASLPKPTWQIEGWIPSGVLVCVYGPSGCGKTFLMVDACCCVAGGVYWHGREVKQGSVVYVLGEGVHGFEQRISAWEQAYQWSGDRELPFYTLPETVPLVSANAAQPLLDAIDKKLPEPPAVIAIDTLSRAAAGHDENSAKDMSLLVENLDALKRATGAVVIPVHHTGKTGTAERGSSVLRAACDTMIEVSGDGRTLQAFIDKQRDAPSGTCQNFEFRQNGFCQNLVAVIGETLTNVSRKMLESLPTLPSEDGSNDGLTNTEWMSIADLPERTFYRSRKFLVEKGFVVNIGTKGRQRWALTEKGRTNVLL